MTRITCIMMLIAFLPLWAQNSTHFEVEAGFQTVEHGDSIAPELAEDSFLSQFGLEEGFLLRTLRYDYSGGEEAGFLDNFRIDASGFGAVPHGYFRIRADKAKIFNLRLDYRAYDHFNTSSLIHSVDRTRQTMDMELAFLPTGKWQPYIGYRWSNYDGPATTTYHLGQDEFFLNSDLSEDETEFRVGLRYHSDRIQAEVMQGWRNLDGDEFLTGSGTGNGRPVLGEDIQLDNYTGTVSYEAETPVTLANLRAYPHQRFKLLVSYVMADAESEVEENEVFTGRFASFRIARFFNGGNASVRSQTESPSWRANFRAEIDLGRGVDLGLGYVKRSLELDGDALMETLYLDSVSFSGFDQRDYLELMDAVSFMEREEDTIEADLSASLPGGFMLQAAYATSDRDLVIDQALAEIVVRGGQEGQFERGIDRTTLMAGWKKGMHRIQLEYKLEEADNAVMRTDYLDRDSLTLRARTGWKDKCLVTAVVRNSESENSAMPPGFAPSGDDDELEQFEQEVMHYSVNVDLTPVKDLVFRINYSVFDFETESWFYAPDFYLEQWRYHEDSDSLGCELTWKTSRVELGGAYSGYDSEGNNFTTSTLDNTRLHVGFNIKENLTLRLEAARYEYVSPSWSPFDYETDVYALLLHWRK